MAEKCKGDDHVDVRSSSGSGDGPGVWTVERIYNFACKNGGPSTVYQLRRNGKPKMNMRAELARVMPSRFRTASNGGFSAKVVHKVAGVWSPRPVFTVNYSGAQDLAAAIEVALAAP